MCLRRAVRHRSFFVNLRRPKSRPKTALRQRMPPHSRFRRCSRIGLTFGFCFLGHKIKTVFFVCVFRRIFTGHKISVFLQHNMVFILQHKRHRGKHRTQNGAYGNYGRHNFKAVFCVFPFVLHTHSPDTLWENNNITEQKIKRLCRISTSYLLIPSAMYLNTGAQSKAPPAPFSLKTVMT